MRYLTTSLSLWLAVFLFPFLVSAQSLPDLFDMVNPAVVDILSISETSVAVSQDEIDDVKVASGDQGSGILIDNEGTILTASHVIQTAEEVTVTFLDGQTSKAKVIASAHYGDIALIKLTEKVNLPTPAVLADSDKVRVGEKVFVVGAPFGYSHSLSVGHISSRFHTPAMLGSGTMEVFQTDAAMNPGNSGGPLFNMQGEVIGIASHIRSSAGAFNGIAFAVTTNQCVALMDRVETWSGIEGVLVSDRLARLFNIPQEFGFLVESVSGASWGGKIGLKPSTLSITINGEEMLVGGDIILKVGDLVVNNDPQFYTELRDYLYALNQSGKKVTVDVLRNGKVLTLPEKGE